MEQTGIVKFEYEGFPISFDFGDGSKLIKNDGNGNHLLPDIFISGNCR